MKTHVWRAVAPLALALAGAVALTGCESSEAAEEAPVLQTAAVERGTITLEAEATGTVEPVRSVEVKSKASGEILRLLTDVGDEVGQGALLAEVDPRDVRNSYDQASADLEVARASTEIARAQLDRSLQLLESQVITEQEHEQTRLDHANARAGLVRAETNFRLAELRLSDVAIRAPLDGTIIQKSVEEGQVIQSASQNVSGGTTLFVMANLDRMRVRALVDETDMGEIRAGMPATVRVEAFPDRIFQGLVQKVEPQAVVEQNVTMFPVIVDLDNQAGLLRPGMNAEVTVLVDRAPGVLMVPNGAVVQVTDIAPAAMALGLDPETLDIPRRARAGFAAREEGGAAAAPGGRAASARGQDSLRTSGRGPRGAATPGTMGAPAGAPEREARPAAVFVLDETGRPQLRMIQVGLNDWDYTQVVSGLEEGETLAVVGAAQLQAQQQEFLERMRSRRGGGPFGG